MMATQANMAPLNDQHRVSDADYRTVMEFLFREAELLDTGRLKEWLDFLAPQISYMLTAPSVAMARPNIYEDEPTVMLMNETLGTLQARVKQLSTPSLTLAENPRPFTRRFVTNILAEHMEDGSLRACSNALIHRTRGGKDPVETFSTRRVDILVRIDGRLKLAQRQARLDQSVINARSLSALF